MKNSKNSAFTDALNVDYQEDSGLWMTNSCTLRKVIGILGMALPLLLWLFLLTVSSQDTPLPSISHYYYTRASGIFTIVVSLLAVFLIVYKGREPVDFYLSTAAGVFALCVLLFPTGNLCVPTDTNCLYNNNGSNVTTIIDNPLRENFHYASAGIFLLCLAYMSFFLFTKSGKKGKQMGAEKIARNRVYRICGVVMVLAILTIFVGGFLNVIPEDVYNNNNLTFWMEAVAVEAFGFAWLVKGEAILEDEPSPSPAKKLALK